MGLEEKLPSGVLLTSVEKLAGWARARSVWPATVPMITEKAAKPAASTASTKIGRYSLIVVSSLHRRDANCLS